MALWILIFLYLTTADAGTSILSRVVPPSTACDEIVMAPDDSGLLLLDKTKRRFHFLRAGSQKVNSSDYLGIQGISSSTQGFVLYAQGLYQVNVYNIAINSTGGFTFTYQFTLAFAGFQQSPVMLAMSETKGGNSRLIGSMDYSVRLVVKTVGSGYPDLFTRSINSTTSTMKVLLKFDANQTMLFAYTNSRFYIWNAISGDLLLNETMNVQDFVLWQSPSTTSVIMGYADGSITSFTFANKSLTRRTSYQSADSQKVVNQMDINSDGTLVIATTNDGAINVFRGPAGSGFQEGVLLDSWMQYGPSQRPLVRFYTKHSTKGFMCSQNGTVHEFDVVDALQCPVGLGNKKHDAPRGCTWAMISPQLRDYNCTYKPECEVAFCSSFIPAEQFSTIWAPCGVSPSPAP